MPERQVLTSLTGTIAPLLSVDVSKKNELSMASFWLPREWKKCAGFVDDDVILTPLGMSGLNLDMTFEMPKNATYVSDMVLGIQLPPYVVTPPGNPASYVDHLGFAIIDHFDTHFGSNLVYTHTALDLYFDYRKRFGIERLDAYDRMIYGDTTTAQRSALLLNGTPPGSPLLVPLMQPFSFDPMSALPLVTLSQKTRYTLKANALANITTLPVPGTTIATTGQTNFVLHVYHINPSGNESSLLLSLSRDDDGLVYMIHQHQRQSMDDFASIQTNFSIVEKLSGITKPLKDLTWALIPTRLTNNTGFNDIFFFAPNPPAPIPAGMNVYSPIVDWRIEANGLVIQRRVDRDYTRLYKYWFYYDGFAGEDVFTQSYTRFPLAENACGGYLDYTNLNNPVLHITTGVGGTGIDPLNAPNPQSLRVIVNARDYNFWFFKSGNWSRTFN